MANIAELLVSVGADIKDLKTKMNQVEKIVGSTGKEVKGLGDNFKNLGTVIGAALSVGAIIQFGKEVIAITAEFQKFEAVLTNTLGSNSEAQIALQQIQEFAAKTPFSVQELTASFVKLANQGFRPTSDQMRALGDLAASTGKSFDQLAEALIDAQTGEFERLKEFGIRAQKEGDKVMFTFKGVKTQVDFTNESISKYITGLGNIEGVTGAMASISGTLGGKLSNLGDSFDQLYVTIGNLTSGPVTWFIDAVNEMVSVTTRLMKSQEQLRKEAHLKTLGKEAEEVSARLNQLTEDNIKLGQKQAEAQANAYSQIKEELESVIALQKKQLDEISTREDNIVDPSRDQLDAIAKEYQSTKELIEINEARLAALDKVITKTNEETTALDKSKKKKEEYTGIIAIEKAKLEELEKARMNVKTAEEVGKYNALIEKQKEAITVLEEYTLATEQAALATIQPQGLDTRTKITPIKQGDALPETFSGNFYKELTAQLQLAKNESIAFGASFDYVSEQAAILTDAIFYLLESGISPMSPMVQELVGKLEQVKVTLVDVGSLVRDVAVDMTTTFAEAIGHMIATGGNLGGFFDGVIMMIVDFVSQFGKLLIAAGIASEAFQKMLMTNPYAAIAAGIALVAAGAAAKAYLKKGPSGGGGVQQFANGGVIYGPTLGIMGEYPGARSNPEVVGKLSDIKGLIGDNEGGGRVVFEIEGNKLKGVLDKQNTRDNRIGR